MVLSEFLFYLMIDLVPFHSYFSSSFPCPSLEINILVILTTLTLLNRIVRPETPITSSSSISSGTASRNKNDETQWPALLSDNLTPKNLKNKVSTMMQEWENSLTPPPEDSGSVQRRRREGQDEDFLTGSPRAVGRES